MLTTYMLQRAKAVSPTAIPPSHTVVPHAYKHGFGEGGVNLVLDIDGLDYQQILRMTPQEARDLAAMLLKHVGD